MTEQEALIEAILDDMADPARRLVYADWLEEHGSFADGIRARMTRLEVQCDTLQKDSAEAAAAARELTKLETRYSWLIIPRLPQGFFDPSIESGLILMGVASSVRRFVEYGEDYLRGLPPPCRFSLEINRKPGKGKLLNLLDSPAWPRVYALVLWGYQLTGTEANHFLSDPRLRNLEVLDIGLAELPDSAIVNLAASPHLTRLRVLELPSNSISDAGLDALATPGALPRLKELSLDMEGLSAEAMARFRKCRPDVEAVFS